MRFFPSVKKTPFMISSARDSDFLLVENEECLAERCGNEVFTVRSGGSPVLTQHREVKQVSSCSAPA